MKRCLPDKKLCIRCWCTEKDYDYQQQLLELGFKGNIRSVFSECVNDLRSYGSFIDGKTVGKMMKEYVMDMTIPDIQCECLCSPTMASAARSETVMLINKTNLLECLRESQVI